MRRRLLAAAAAVVVCAMVVAIISVLVGPGTSESEPSTAASTTPSPTPSSAPTTSGPPAPANDADAIAVPAVGISSRVVPSRINARGELSLPGLEVAGWYRDTAPPGSPVGSTLIASHADSVVDGKDRTSPWLHLARLRSGDPVTLTWSGQRLRYTVTRVVTRPGVGALPTWTVDPASPARIVLVTCGGELSKDPKVTGTDDGKYHWSSRILVVAEPMRR